MCVDSPNGVSREASKPRGNPVAYLDGEEAGSSAPARLSCPAEGLLPTGEAVSTEIIRQTMSTKRCVVVAKLDEHPSTQIDETDEFRVRQKDRGVVVRNE